MDALLLLLDNQWNVTSPNLFIEGFVADPNEMRFQ